MGQGHSAYKILFAKTTSTHQERIPPPRCVQAVKALIARLEVSPIASPQLRGPSRELVLRAV